MPFAWLCSKKGGHTKFTGVLTCTATHRITVYEYAALTISVGQMMSRQLLKLCACMRMSHANAGPMVYGGVLAPCETF